MMRAFFLFLLVAVSGCGIVDACSSSPVHCEWNAWNSGTACSEPCGTGSRTRTRTKKVVEKDGGSCSGPSTKTEACNTHECPVDCIWSYWLYGACSKSCGGGTRTNTRTKIREDRYGGSCEGKATYVETCNTNTCPVHCVWDNWVTGECSKSCGTGTRTNTRTKLIPEAYGGTCTGQSTEIEQCNTQKCPVDCEWDEWQIGSCSKTCGGGTQTDTRKEATQAAHGGEECSGSSTITKSCNIQECPVNCEWGPWEDEDCSKSCGGGIRTSYREKTVPEQFGGICEGNPTKEESCNDQECPVDCKWGPWTVTECDKTCGGGTLTKTREITQGSLYGGESCVGLPSVTESCNVQECPVDCKWSDWVVDECSVSCGKGEQPMYREIVQEHLFGGTPCTGLATDLQECIGEDGPNCPVNCEWNDWTFGECSVTCGGGTRLDTRTLKSEALYGGYCDPKGDTREESCNTEVCPPIHCVWDEWTPGPCSKTCGTGIQINTRTKLVVERDGGTCTGPDFEEKECKIIECPVHCEWDEWKIGQCSVTCGGGTRTNTREKKVEAEHGGDECEGEPSLEESCSVDECPVDCIWGQFVPGDCSVTCGTGRQTKTRTILAAEQYGGEPCKGETYIVEECDMGACPIGKEDCPEEKSSSCSTYATHMKQLCEDIPRNAWFLGEDGRYCCRKSCGLC